jgi:diguanylate cyclase (GGDEF)-like protein
VAVALTYSSLLPGRERAAVWWCWSMWVVTLGLVLLSLRSVLPAWLAMGMGNALALLGYGLAYKGYRVFRDARTFPFIAWIGAVLWLFLYFGVEAFRNDLSSRVVVSASIIVFYTALAALEAWRGWKDDRLPSFVALLVLFSTHSMVHLGRGVIVFLYSAESRDPLVTLWLGAISLENFVHVIGISFFFFALTRERVERKYRLAAEIDGLTGAATRRFFVSQTRERLAKKPKAGVLAVIDIDFFKSVNDCYGHLGGDRVLQAFGRHIEDRLQPGMIFGRLGGEEFGLFLPDMEASDARVWLEQLRSDVEAMQIPFMGSPIRITISLGAAAIREVGLDFDHLMAAADGALYLAKEEGRNRLRVFTLSMRMHQITEENTETRLGLAQQRLSRINVRSRIGRPS